MSCLLLAALLSAATAVARPPDPAGALVLRIDGRDAYFDLGRTSGAGPGVRVLFFRTVSLLDPRTGGTVRDRFLVTEAEISEAGEVLSRARLEPEVAAAVRVGDRVELSRPMPMESAPPPLVIRDLPPAQKPGRPPTREGPPDQPPAAQPAGAAQSSEPTREQREAAEFTGAFVRAQQLSAPVRILFWNKWVKEHAGGPLSTAVAQELEVLKSLDGPRAPAQAQAAAPPPPPPRPDAPEVAAPEVAAPSAAFDNDPIEIVLTWPGLPPQNALLNWRPRGFPLFETVRFAPDGQHTVRARLPAGATPPPGVEWWASVPDGDKGAERPIAGTGTDPRTVTIATAPGLDIPSRKDRSRGTLWVDYADWNRFKGNDWFVDVEGEFLYRVLSGLHSIRMGFGLYQGQGQSLQSALQDEKSADKVYHSTAIGYHYGYTELEFHPHEMFGVMGKLLTGVDRSGFGAGFEGRIRIGREEGTNLVLGSGFTKGIGNKNDITLSWDRVQGWPMAASVIVTNEPVMADYGVRFLYQVGRSVTDFCDLSARLSYQLRDINHNGFGAGLSASFHW